MDHSIRGYLSRRTTEELEVLLKYCLTEENHENYRHAVLEILKILEQRYVPTDDSPSAMQALERLQQLFENGTEDSAGGRLPPLQLH